MAEKLGGEPRSPATDAMLIIFPRRCAIMTLPTAREKRNVPVKLVSMTLFHCSSVIASTGAPQEVPALFDRGVGHGFNAGRIFDIAAEREHFDAEAFQFFGRLQAGLFLSRAENQIRPHLRQALRHLPTKPNGSPGNDGYTTAKIKKLLDVHSQILSRAGVPLESRTVVG